MGGILGGLSRIAEQAGEADLYKQQRDRQLQTQYINDQIGKAQLRLMQIQAQQEGQPKTTVANTKWGLFAVTTEPSGKVSYKQLAGPTPGEGAGYEQQISKLSPDAQKAYGSAILWYAQQGNTQAADSLLTKALAMKPTTADVPKVISVGGIPYGVTVNDPTSGAQKFYGSKDIASAPPDAQSAYRSATDAYKQSLSQKSADEQRRNALIVQRERGALFGLTPGGGAAGTPSRPSRLHGEPYISTLPAKIGSLVREIGTGKMPLERYGYILTRNPALMTMVAQAYPDFDGSKVQSYVATVKDFTSGKTAIALNAGATALKHMEELKNLNTISSRVPGTADNKAFNNKLDVLVGELARFYQMPSTNQTHDSLKSTLGGYFNRDAAITSQANSMADKLASFARQWLNSAPSSAYQAPMPRIDEKAKAALHALDPNFDANYPDIAALFAVAGKGSGGVSGPPKGAKVISLDDFLKGGK